MAPGHLGRWSDGIIGLSYLWEGQVLLAERILRPALLQADADLGRRNPFPCMLASLLAAALTALVGGGGFCGKHRRYGAAKPKQKRYYGKTAKPEPPQQFIQNKCGPCKIAAFFEK